MQQPPFYQTPSPPPKRQSFPRTVPLWFFLITLALVIVIAFIAGRIMPGSTVNTSASTTTQVNSPSNGITNNATDSGNAGTNPAQVTVTSSTKWKTVKSYSNTGNLKTEQITVTAPWQLAASCVPNSWDGMSFNFSVEIDHPDGHWLEPAAVNYLCSEGDDSESFVEYYGGTYYLKISGFGTWSLDIQELEQ